MGDEVGLKSCRDLLQDKDSSEPRGGLLTGADGLRGQASCAFTTAALLPCLRSMGLRARPH